MNKRVISKWNLLLTGLPRVRITRKACRSLWLAKSLIDQIVSTAPKDFGGTWRRDLQIACRIHTAYIRAGKPVPLNPVPLRTWKEHHYMLAVIAKRKYERDFGLPKVKLSRRTKPSLRMVIPDIDVSEGEIDSPFEQKVHDLPPKVDYESLDYGIDDGISYAIPVPKCRTVISIYDKEMRGLHLWPAYYSSKMLEGDLDSMLGMSTEPWFRELTEAYPPGLTVDLLYQPQYQHIRYGTINGIKRYYQSRGNAQTKRE
jgi:hypothetical protein